MNFHIKLLFFLFSLSLFSQENNSIKIYDEATKTPLERGVFYVSYKEVTTYYFFDKGTIELLNIPDESVIEIKVDKYLSFKDSVKNIRTNNINVAFLRLDDSYILDEIIIDAPQKIKIANDTVKYNVKSLMDGTEMKLEDLLKKLPGIQVDQKSGQIKYKGTPIETILLDGENLFDKNYVFGSKNLDINLVDEIQAIDNYHKNKLHKGVTTSNRKVLNLKFNKDAVGISFDNNIGAGLFSDKKITNDMNVATLLVKNDVKSFGVISYDNIDKDNFNKYINKNEEYRINNYINQNIIAPIESNNINVSKKAYANINNIIKISPKSSLRNEIYIYKNITRTNEELRSLYFLNKDTLITHDFTDKVIKPLDISVVSTWNNEINHKSNLELTLNYLFNDMESKGNNILKEEKKEYSSFSDTKNNYFNIYALYTYKISSKNLYDVKLGYVFNNVEEALFFDEKHYQNIQQNRNYIYFVNNHFFKNKYFTNRITLNSRYNNMRLDSNNNISGTGLEEHAIFKNNLSITTTLSTKKMILETKNDFIYHNISYKTLYGISNKQNTFFYNPSLSLDFLINKLSKINLKSGISNKSLTEDFFNSNPIMLNNRSILFYRLSNNKNKLKNFTTSYSLNDMYNQFFFIFNLYHEETSGSYVPNNYFKEDIIYTEMIYSDLKQKSYGINTNISKFFYRFKTNFKAEFNYNKSYNSFFADSIENKSISNYLTTEYEFKSTVFPKLNIHNNIRLGYIQNRSENLALDYYRFDYNGKVIYKYSNRLNFTLEYQLFIPDLKSNDKTGLMNLSSVYQIKNNYISFSLNNIFNNKFIFRRDNTLMSYNDYSYKILPLFFTINTVIRF